MPRSRSRSPKRERRRSRDRDRSRDKDRDRDRQRRHRRSRSGSRPRDNKRSRSRSRDRRRRSRSRERRGDDRDRGRDFREFGDRADRDQDRGGEESEEETLVFQKTETATPTEDEIQNLPEEDQDLMRTMGFSGFNTTKDKQVVGNDMYAANIAKKRRYRQYMNRKGGFNRPLDFIA